MADKPDMEVLPASVQEDSPRGAVKIDRRKLELIKKTIFKDATDDELQLFKYICEKRQLDPFARQIYARKQKQWNSSTGQYEMQVLFITGIDGFRLIGERSKQYAGQLGPFWTKDGKEWTDVWVESTPPRAAKVAVLRHDFKEPLWAMARFDAYCPKKDGKPTGTWGNMPEGQIAKCAEALALRRAFPEDLSGLYTADEMQQAGQEPLPEISDRIHAERDYRVEDTESAEGDPPYMLPTTGLLKEYPRIYSAVGEQFQQRCEELNIRLKGVRERYPNWPESKQMGDLPIAQLPALAAAFDMEFSLPR